MLAPFYLLVRHDSIIPYDHHCISPMGLTPDDSMAALPTAYRPFNFKYYGDAPAPQGTTPGDVIVNPPTGGGLSQPRTGGGGG